MWQKYDITISDTTATVGLHSYQLNDLSNFNIVKDERFDAIPLLWAAASLGLGWYAWDSFQNAPYEASTSPLMAFKIAILLALGAVVCFYIASQKFSRPSEIKYRLDAKAKDQTKVLYAHSDLNIVQEIKAAFEKASISTKR